MLNLIDYTYFVDKTLIPNANDTGFVGQALVNAINRYITRYQQEILVIMLGQTLYDEFAIGKEIFPIPQKWKTLNGKIIDANVIQCYVWYHYFRDNLAVISGIGDGIPTGQNFTFVANDQRVVDVWAEMIINLKAFNTYMLANIATYPTYVYDPMAVQPLNIFSL